MNSMHAPVYYYTAVNQSCPKPTLFSSYHLTHQNLLSHQYAEEPGYANPIETELDMQHRSSHMSAVHDVDAVYSTLDPKTRRHSAVHVVDATYSTLDTKVTLSPHYQVERGWSTWEGLEYLGEGGWRDCMMNRPSLVLFRYLGEGGWSTWERGVGVP